MIETEVADTQRGRPTPPKLVLGALIAALLGVTMSATMGLAQPDSPTRRGCPELVAYLNQCREVFCATYGEGSGEVLGTDCTMMFTALLEQARRIPTACEAGMAQVEGMSCAELAHDAFARAHRDTAIVQLRMLRDAVDTYRLLHREPPPNLEALTGDADNSPILDRIPTDPWGNPYLYRPSDDGTYAVLSLGPDGTVDTDDDIVVD